MRMRYFFRICLLIIGSLVLICNVKAGPVYSSATVDVKVGKTDTIQKVMNAMLAMQRRAWEQGVASQALLELGEKDLVILMAKDAVVNQRKDGRLGLNEGDKPIADPASNGEPVLYAAKI